MKGRKPIPTALKLIRGNPGKRPLPANEPRIKPAEPKPPAHLSDDARKQWRKLVKQLAAAGIMTELDTDALSLYCDAYDRYMDANEKLREFGTVVKAPNGLPAPSPYLAVANRAFDQMKSMLTEFGMTPSSRTRVSKAGVDDKKNDFDDL